VRGEKKIEKMPRIPQLFAYAGDRGRGGSEAKITKSWPVPATSP